MQVVRAVNSKELNWSRFVHLVEDTWRVLQLLSNWKYCHVGRAGNNTAHLMAKMDVQHVIDRIWLENSPYCIYDIILRE
jgi:hypothetical protein